MTSCLRVQVPVVWLENNGAEKLGKTNCCRNWHTVSGAGDSATCTSISKQIPHTGNTRPSCTCVIQDYRFYTMSLGVNTMGVLNTMSPCLYHKSLSIP